MEYVIPILMKKSTFDTEYFSRFTCNMCKAVTNKKFAEFAYENLAKNFEDLPAVPKYLDFVRM